MANPMKVQVHLNSIREYGCGVFLLRFYPISRKPRFKEGQFLHLTLEEFDPTSGFWPESRVFSIASSPDDEWIEVLFSVKGVYTLRMANELCVGDTYWIKMPYGDFILEKHIESRDRVILVAGGTGISPFLAYLYRLVQDNSKGPELMVYYGVRDPLLLVHPGLFEKLSLRINTNVEIWCEEGDANTIRINRFKSGMFDVGLIVDSEISILNNKYFLSGPPSMINTFKDTLLSRGIESSKIIIDEWE